MNVLFVTADQWRGDCLSCLGHPAVRTPNLDRLAGDGVLFERHFAQATPCGPSRASLHTGLYALNHRSITNGTPLDARHKTLAGLVRAAGWDPVLFGYTDTSADPRTLPADSPWLRTYEGVTPGFRVELRLAEAEEAYLDHLAERGYGRLTFDEVYGGGFRRPAPFRAEDSVTAFMADRFLGWLDRQNSEPWFAHVSFLKPHRPCGAGALVFGGGRDHDPTRFAHRRPKPREPPSLARGAPRTKEGGADRRHLLDGESLARLRAVYCGLIAEVDHHFGRILQQLAQRANWTYTCRVHRRPWGDAWRPLDARQGGLLSAGVPCPIAAASSRGVRGRRVTEFTEHIDVMPTILESLTLEIPRQCDGRSLSTFLTADPPCSWRSATHWEHDFRDVVTCTYEQALGLDSDACSLAVRFDGRCGYVHFAALPPAVLHRGFRLAVRSGTRSDLRWRGAGQAQGMLSWRLMTAERRLTECALDYRGRFRT